MYFKRRAKTKDQATKSLMKSGVYRLSDDKDEKERPRRSCRCYRPLPTIPSTIGPQ